jgi:hypothetical protein
MIKMDPQEHFFLFNNLEGGHFCKLSKEGHPEIFTFFLYYQPTKIDAIIVHIIFLYYLKYLILRYLAKGKRRKVHMGTSIYFRGPNFLIMKPIYGNKYREEKQKSGQGFTIMVGVLLSVSFYFLKSFHIDESCFVKFVSV